MRPETRFAALMRRIAVATNISRSQDENAARNEQHGGEPADLSARIEAALPDLEKVALRLEGRNA